MTATEVRSKFLDYFRNNGHKIVDSAPIVVKDDPTLMFTNAGMNQFKDYFLGNKVAEDVRVADTQKCLRVSGKHNDLEEVGVDTYHHTMFEMLGNWSFGDYFKEDAIKWAWELLTEVYNLPKDRLYVTVFEGDKEDKLDADFEAAKIWEKYIDKDRILYCDKTDNFWEMGDSGPCGPCSEIHMDLRPQSEIDKEPGKPLVNQDHDQVIELWNLVFIQYNRKADKSLENLPQKHVDTGMGLERVVRAIGLKSSNYDTDLFMDTIRELEKISSLVYGKNEKTDIAFRVIADHLRAVSFTIADGQLPDNSGAGYVIRRILRRAVRYGYSFLTINEPFIYKLVQGLADKFGNIFPDLLAQKDFVQKVIEQEEKSFLNTLNNGLKLFESYSSGGSENISGENAFELYDTFGFPIDLTQLLAKEKGVEVDFKGFQTELQKQKDRSRADAQKESGDWIVVKQDDRVEFVGYDFIETEISITRYREVEAKGKKLYHLVFNITPFYAESGGQVGDRGVIIGQDNDEKIGILDTQKENQLILQITDKLPTDLNQSFLAKVNSEKRYDTTNNHSATHLLNAALNEVLGDHVNQKGSLVNEKHLRFDFSHFQKVEKHELALIEQKVNEKIREAIALDEARNVPFDEAVSSGANALFGEKYGDVVRVIAFDKDFSIELCGGTHVPNTAQIGSFRIVSESAVAAGVRRIEAITGKKADDFVQSKIDLISEIGETLGSPQDIIKAIQSVQKENSELKAKVAVFEAHQIGGIKAELKKAVVDKNGVNVIISQVDVANAGQIKDLCFSLKEEVVNLFCVLLANIDGKPSISIMISEAVIKSKGWNAGQLIREWAKHVKGGGGGQPFFAQAGGADVSGLPKVKEIANEFVNA
ncbi:MAG: alanine--tRNA ligase [Bacteroidia bacterium]|nr:alanine--tRNA ligase [Bacteroidia bacterium]